jgi:hypothetical protein
MRRHMIKLGCLLVAIVFLGSSGCDIQNIFGLSEINTNITEIKKQIGFLNAEISALRADLNFQRIMMDRYSAATFDPAAGEGFSRLDSSVGTFAVSILDIKPLADGVIIRLHVGNLTTATIRGGTFSVKYGPRGPSPTEKNWVGVYTEWEKNLKQMQSKFTNDLRPGTWNIVRLTLPGIPPSQFGYMELRMMTDQISLFRTQ